MRIFLLEESFKVNVCFIHKPARCQHRRLGSKGKKNVKNTDVCTSGGRVAFRVGDGIKEKALFYKYL